MKRLVLATCLLPLVVGALSCRRPYLPAPLGAHDSGSEAPDEPARCPAGLDLGFDQQGRHEIRSGIPIIRAVFAQADGQVVAVGEGLKAPLQGDSPTVFAAVRLLGDGRPDPTFGVGGTATAQLLPNGHGRVTGGALQSDGKVIVVGAAFPSGSPDQWLVARFNQDGSLDTSFGSGADTPAVLTGAFQTSVALLADGSLLVAGTIRVPLGDYCCDGNVVVAKYDARGRLDPKFGSGGLVITPVGVATGDDYAYALVGQPDGRIVVGGHAYTAGDGGSTPQQEAMLLRYTANGTLDSAFGRGGIVLTSSYARVNALALQSDGNLLVSLSVPGIPSELAVGRYTTAGALDPTFGSDGVARLELPPADGPPEYGGATALFSLGDGSIVVAGSLSTESFFLAKLGAQGALDSAFGNDGLVKTSLAAGAAASTGDGKAVVAGSRSVDAGGLPVVERYCL